MKNMKKLTALISALTLVVCAVPANVCAENDALDWNNSGEANRIDGYYFINYLEYIENRPLTDFSMYEIDIENYIESEDGVEEINKKRDLNGDGVIDKRDFVTFVQRTRGYSLNSNVSGDVNMDGCTDAVDGYMIKYYFEDLAEGNEDYYSATQLSFFEHRGDANEDGVVDMADADFILSGAYEEKLYEYCASISSSYPVGAVLLDEYINDDSDSGDVNHDGLIDAVDATMISEYYAYLSVTGTEHDNSIFYTYTEEQTADIYAYGDVNEDGYINSIDASFILNKYAKNSTLQ